MANFEEILSSTFALLQQGEWLTAGILQRKTA
jgi:hypothetical protein